MLFSNFSGLQTSGGEREKEGLHVSGVHACAHAACICTSGGHMHPLLAQMVRAHLPLPRPGFEQAKTQDWVAACRLGTPALKDTITES